jgi:radical SAM superfamily enzyme YgiQ (UPF0313 family)
MDVVVCNFPPMWPWYIPAAPGILLGACKWLNLKSDFVDFAQLQALSVTDTYEWAKHVTDKKPKLVAFSLFSYLAQDYSKQVARHIKSIDPTIKIIVGGPGIKNEINSTNLSYVDNLIDKKLIDYYHDGDGEYAWPKFLIEFFKLKVVVNENDLNIPYFPDYSNFDIEYYQSEANKRGEYLWIPITGSRGCVRKCTFCEIHEHWKFTQRSADHIAEEIRQTLKFIPKGNLNFTDSLINGVMPEFHKLLDHLIKIKKDYPHLRWTSQFIIRNDKVCGKDYWKKIADSGAYAIQIGVETGSDRLRADMRKQFTNEDLDISLSNMQKYGITCTFLMIVGYPTETEEDWKQTLDLLHKYKHLAGNIIRYINLGGTMTIDPGTPIYKEAKAGKDIIISKDAKVWFNKKNPGLTLKERLSRRNQIEELANTLGYPLFVDNHIMRDEIVHTMEKHQKIIKIVEEKL